MFRVSLISIVCLMMPGCTGQDGNYVVQSRSCAGWSNAGGGLETLIGYSRKEPKRTTLLLAIVAATPSETLTRRDMTGGDGTMVSATNLSYGADRNGTFGYGSIWNRTSDLLAIDGDEFERSKGNVFVVVPTGKDNLRIQILGSCESTDPTEILRYAQDRLDYSNEEIQLIRKLELK